MSSYSVFLSPIAEKKLILLLEYLEIEWGVKSKKDYLKQSAFFYRINKIEIITIIDNRQNPEIIKKELRKLK